MIRHRRWMLSGLAMVAASPLAAQDGPLLEVWRDPNCGCCGGWVAHMRASGFTVRESVVPALGPVRQMLRTRRLTFCPAMQRGWRAWSWRGTCPRSPYGERLPTVRAGSSGLRCRPCRSARPGWRFPVSRTRFTT